MIADEFDKGAKTYTCENCHETFEKGWTDEEARAEYEQEFKTYADTKQPISLVCDECYRKIMRWVRSGDR